MAFEKFDDIKKRWSSFKDHHASKKAAKGARITSKVLWNLLIVFLIFGLIGTFFAGGVGAGYFASLVKDEKPRSFASMKEEVYNYEETSQVYFADNVLLGNLRTDLQRDEVRLNEVSDHVIQAVIATEDEYFYEHEGVVPKAIARAIFQEVTNSSVQTGGSTLTQQLIKNQLLTREVSFERKAKEILLALRLEHALDKDEILEAYLNIVPFGRNASGRNIAGVQTAAQGIFGVDAKDLTLPQAAFIAGLPQSPYGYTPFNQYGELKENLDPGISRMKTVLDRMRGSGFITEKEFKQASAYDITKDFAKRKDSPLQKYPYVMQEVERRAVEILAKQMAKEDGVKQEDLYKDNNKLLKEYEANADSQLRKSGYRIHTTINKEIYDKMQEIKNNYTLYGSEKAEWKVDPKTGEKVKVMEPVETAAIMIENKTGRIISFVGGRDFERQQQNHATQALRPNGSTMKPLLVYAPAMEFGAVQPGSVLIDAPITFKTPTGPYNPKNYGGGYKGLTSARNALAKSYNVPAVETFSKIVNREPVQFLKKMGFTSLEKGDGQYLSSALGPVEVTIEENVNAYATFGNGGKFVDAYMIEKIESKDGDIIYQHKSEQVDVFTPQTNYLMLDMMRDVLKSGTAASTPKRLKFYADWAGKTGTSQSYKDAWFVATNPNITFGTWMGYDTPKSLQKSYKGYSYSNRNQKLWAELMNAAYDIKPELVKPQQSFKMPGGIVRRSYCAMAGLLPSSVCAEMGLMQSDLYNVKYLPKEKDGSADSVKYIVRNGTKFIVPDSAPDEFVEKGLMLGGDAAEELSKVIKYLPETGKFGNFLSPDSPKINDNGKAPSPIGGVKLSGKSLSWPLPGEKDIIGYRIYQASSKNGSFRRVANVPANVLSYTVPGTTSAYYVTAVDVAGKESAPSAIVGGPPEPEPEPKPKEEKPSKPKEDDNTNEPPADDDQPGETDSGTTNGGTGDGENPPPEDDSGGSGDTAANQ
ncbi:transglycosylase domain-containing protein [Bacillus marinisedimentorum]|uniref:transglycosylase domain-containing protein n=1 Tax=Bacillus marinisedimentorum TaxID=1821260 RepID=UPI0007DF0AF5|nr:transglycosylase domain-containing protein [Bacillus marinisedimentorum]